MFNLAEILTLLIGCLLALVFIDGIRRALRIRKSKLKVDLINPTPDQNIDFEEEWMQGYENNKDSQDLSDVEEDEINLDIEPQPAINLNIIHLHDNENSSFSESSLSQALVFYNFLLEDKGFFTILDSDQSPAFNILNGKNPGIFSDGTNSNDIALVFSAFFSIALFSGVSAMMIAGPRVAEQIGKDYSFFKKLGSKNSNGNPVAAVQRIPKNNDIRSNIHVGGTVVKTKLTRNDLKICDAIKDELIKNKLFFVGIDIIGNYLTEINVTSPTCIQEIIKLSKIDVSRKIWDELLV